MPHYIKQVPAWLSAESVPQEKAALPCGWAHVDAHFWGSGSAHPSVLSPSRAPEQPPLQPPLQQPLLQPPLQQHIPAKCILGTPWKALHGNKCITVFGLGLYTEK